MAREFRVVARHEACQPRCGPGAKQVALDLSEPGVKKRLPFIGETDLPGVEGRIPERREEQAVVDIEAMGVVVAFGPGNDVRGAQEIGITNPRCRAAVVPIFEQRLAE